MDARLIPSALSRLTSTSSGMNVSYPKPVSPEVSPVSAIIPVTSQRTVGPMTSSEAIQTRTPSLTSVSTVSSGPTVSEAKPISSGKGQTQASSLVSRTGGDADSVSTISSTTSSSVLKAQPSAPSASDRPPAPIWTGPSESLVQTILPVSTATTESSAPKWIFPVAIGAIAVGLAYYLMKKR